MNLGFLAFLSYIALIIFLYIKFPMFFIGSLVFVLLCIVYLSVFSWTIPYDTDLWEGGAGD